MSLYQFLKGSLNFQITNFIIFGVITSQVALAQNASHSTGTMKPNSTTQVIASVEAEEITDSFLAQILCTNLEFKIWKEGLYRARKSASNADAIKSVFSENLFYSLMPGQERKEFKSAIPEIFKKTESIVSDLKDLAVFFSSTIHEIHEANNKKRSETGLSALSKDEFLDEFTEGKVAFGDKSIDDYKKWVDRKIEALAQNTKDLKYGCAGNKNFIYRANSKLGSVIDIDAFVIPATKISAKKISDIQESAEENDNHNKQRYGKPKAAVLADNTAETEQKARELYKPDTTPKVVRLEQMVGATFYFTPSEADARYRGAKAYRIFDINGNVIARVSEEFYSAIKLQGAGILADGRTINYVKQKNGTPRFTVTNSKYGLGKSSNALKPWKSLALDFNHYKKRGVNLKIGQKIYIPSTHGLKIPGTNLYHDGMWEVADVGGAIHGARIDMFTGTMHWKDALAYVKNPSNYDDRKRNHEAANLGDRKRQVTVKIMR